MSRWIAILGLIIAAVFGLSDYGFVDVSSSIQDLLFFAMLMNWVVLIIVERYERAAKRTPKPD